MDFLSYLPRELWVNEALQSSFLSYFHPFFVLLSFMDTTPYYLCVCAFVRVALPGREGFKNLYLLTFVPFLASFLKHSFDLPRPGYFVPSLDLVGTGTWYGFPSGAAMGAVVIGFLIARFVRGARGKLLGGLYFFFISLSRVYLGAHFFLDVLAGTFFGALVLGAFLLVESSGILESVKRTWLFAFGLVWVSMMYFVHPRASTLELALMLFGFMVFHFKLPEVREASFSLQKLVFVLLGLFGLFALTQVVKGSLLSLTFVCIGGWLSTLSSFCYHLVHKKEKSVFS